MTEFKINVTNTKKISRVQVYSRSRKQNFNKIFII